MDNPNRQRTIGLHPCVGKRATGEDRPTSVVIRNADGTHVVHEVDEQQLLDFFTCGAVVAWRDATIDDLTGRPPHHYRWGESDAAAYAAYVPMYPARRDDELTILFRVTRKKSTNEVTGYFRCQVAATLVTLDLDHDIVGVANGGLGYQIIEALLGRYPAIDVRTIGSGSLKERRPEFDHLLPKALRRQAEKLRATASGTTPSDSAQGDDADASEEEEAPSKAAAKDANAKFDAHRIAFGLADEIAAKRFHRCTLRDRDWAAVNVAYGQLESARKARVAAEQQFRQIHRAELRRLIKDTRVPHVTLSVPTVGEEKQTIASLLETYEATLRIGGATDKVVARKMEVLRQAHTRIEGARVTEEEMEKHLDVVLGQLPEYTEFLVAAKAAVDPESGLPLGKYIGGRIFGRWIAGFGSPMASRINEPVRQSDVERIAVCRRALTDAITALDRAGLPEQPPSGGGKTREWLLACERILTERRASAQPPEQRLRLIPQLAQVVRCRVAYRAFTNARKCAKSRPLNRAIAFMGLHVRQGGKYEGTPKDREFPRRRKGGRANWNEHLLRQGAYQWASLIMKGGDSYWKVHVFQPHKDRLIAGGMAKGHAQKRAEKRMTTVAMRWLLNEWFRWERSRAQAEPTAVKDAA